MSRDDSPSTDSRSPEIRRFRAVWTGIVVGAAIVVVGVTAVALIVASPSWHHGDALPGAEVRWYILGVAAATIAPALIHIAARARTDSRRDALDIGATLVGIAAIVVVLFVSRSARAAASDRQILPGVLDLDHILWFVAVVGLVIGAANLATRRTTIRHRSRHRLGRRFAAGLIGAAAILGTVATLAAWPSGASPQLDGAQTWQNVDGDGPVRIDWDEPPGSEERWRARIPAPVAGGFVIPGDRSLTAYSGGEQRWRLGFGGTVRGVWGTRSELAGDSWLLVQVGYPSVGTLLTYGIDGRSGDIEWSTDRLAAITHAQLSGDDATVLDDGSVDEVSRDDGTVVERVRLRLEDGCTMPRRFDVIGDGIAVPLECTDRPDRFAVYRGEADQPRQVVTGTDFGASNDEDVRITASDGGVAAVRLSGNGILTTRFLGEDGPLSIADVPDGATVTALTDRGRGVWTVRMVTADGTATVAHATPAQNKTVTVPTGVRGDADSVDVGRDEWAYVGDALVTASAYAQPQDVDGVAQLAPLTYIGAPIPGSGTDRTAPALTVSPNPCRQTATPRHRVFAIDGAGVLLRCDGPPEAREWFWVR